MDSALSPAQSGAHRLVQFARLILIVAVWAVLWTPLYGDVLRPYLGSQLPAAESFIYGIVIAFVGGILFEIAFLAVLMRIESASDIRRFFNVGRLDVKGIWLAFGLGVSLQVINAAFLWNALLKPARDFLVSAGVGGGKIGLGTGEALPVLSVWQAVFLTVFLLAFWWLEVPEEMFFRGYIQSRLQNIVGKNAALFFSALFWDLAHLWSLANIVERFLYGLLYALVFRVRQNTTSTMIVHPIGNRSLLLFTMVPQIWGATVDTSQPLSWLALLVVYALLVLAVIGGWRLLKLDRTGDIQSASGQG